MREQTVLNKVEVQSTIWKAAIRQFCLQKPRMHWRRRWRKTGRKEISPRTVSGSTGTITR